MATEEAAEETAVEAEEKPEEFQVSGYNNGTGIGPGDTESGRGAIW